MKTVKRLLIAFVVVAAVSNLPIINKYILYKLDQSHFRYANLNASFTRQVSFGFKSLNISDWSIKRFADETKPTPENSTVYRLYRINPLCFWRWSYYVFTSRKFQYRNWEDIAENRVPYDPDNMWQDF